MSENEGGTRENFSYKDLLEGPQMLLVPANPKILKKVSKKFAIPAVRNNDLQVWLIFLSISCLVRPRKTKKCLSGCNFQSKNFSLWLSANFKVISIQKGKRRPIFRKISISMTLQGAQNPSFHSVSKTTENERFQALIVPQKLRYS